MKSLIKRFRTPLMILAIVFALSGLVVVVANSGVVYADAKADVCAGIATTGGGACGGGGTALNNAIRFAINMLSAIAGIIGVIMIIVAGIKYMTSEGDGGQVKAAKNSVIYAIVGLVIAALAQVIVRFVLTKVK